MAGKKKKRLVNGDKVEYLVVRTERIQAGIDMRRNKRGPDWDVFVESVVINGVIQPITLRKKGDVLLIVDGHRRVAAAKEANIEEIRAFVVQADNATAMRMAFIQNVHRLELTPVERGEYFRTLRDDFKYTLEEIGEQTGYSTSYVGQLIHILDLPDTMLADVQSGELNVSHAKVLLGCAGGSDDNLQGIVYDKIKDGNLSAKHAARIAITAGMYLESANFDTTDCVTCPHNTRQQAELFHAHPGEKDRCLKPSCFQNKTEAEYNKRIKDAENRGINVHYVAVHGTPKIDGTAINLSRTSVENDNEVDCHYGCEKTALVIETANPDDPYDHTAIHRVSTVCLDETCYLGKYTDGAEESTKRAASDTLGEAEVEAAHTRARVKEIRTELMRQAGEYIKRKITESVPASEDLGVNEQTFALTMAAHIIAVKSQTYPPPFLQKLQEMFIPNGEGRRALLISIVPYIVQGIVWNDRAEVANHYGFNPEKNLVFTPTLMLNIDRNDLENAIIDRFGKLADSLDFTIDDKALAEEANQLQRQQGAIPIPPEILKIARDDVLLGLTPAEMNKLREIEAAVNQYKAVLTNLEPFPSFDELAALPKDAQEDILLGWTLSMQDIADNAGAEEAEHIGDALAALSLDSETAAKLYAAIEDKAKYKEAYDILAGLYEGLLKALDIDQEPSETEDSTDTPKPDGELDDGEPGVESDNDNDVPEPRK